MYKDSAHCLNLVIVDSVKSVSEADCFFSLLQKLHCFCLDHMCTQNGTTARKKMYDGQPRELPKLSDTRWACRHTACRNLLDRLPAVYHLLQEIGLELAAAVSLVESLLDTLQQYRSEAFFEVVWKEVEEMVVKCDPSLERTERRQPKMNRWLCDYIVTTSTGERRVDENDRENFKRHAFYPVLDSMTGELQRRFSKPNCTIMKGIQALHPQSITFLQEEALFSFAKIFVSLMTWQ